MKKIPTTSPAIDENEDNLFLKPVRYIIFIGAGYYTCKDLRQSLKVSEFYCLTDCYKTIKRLEKARQTYLPDCIVCLAKPWSIFFLKRKIRYINEIMPGVRLAMHIWLPEKLKTLISEKYHLDLIRRKKNLVSSLEKLLR